MARRFVRRAFLWPATAVPVVALTWLSAPSATAVPTYLCAGHPATAVLTVGEEYNGTDGPDVVVVLPGAGYAIIRTGAGDDIVCDASSTNWGTEIWLGPGDDVAYAGLGDDVVYGQAGSDTVYGGAGNDTINGDSAYSPPAGDDVLNGDGGDDLIRGGGGADQVNGGTGDDRLYGNDGIAQDTITASSGTDECWRDAGEVATGCETLHIGIGGIGT